QRLKTARNLRNISSLYDVTQGVFGHSLGHRSHSFVTNRDFRTDPFVTEGRPVGGHARVTSRPLARTRCVDPVAVRRPDSGSLPIGEHVRGRLHAQVEHVLRPGDLHGDVLTVAGDLDFAL